MRVEELSQITQKVGELNSWLDQYGLEVIVQSKSSAATVTAVPQKRKVVSGFSQYWDIIDKISKREGITKHAAKALYEQKKSEFVTLTVKESVSKGMKIYWDKVRDIAREKGITNQEARKLLPKTQAVQNVVNI
jgi:hypothetical protein